MAGTHTTNGITFKESGNPASDLISYGFELNKARQLLLVQIVDSPEYNKTTKLIAAIVKRQGELTVIVNKADTQVKNKKTIEKALEDIKLYEGKARQAADSQDVAAYEAAVNSVNVAREKIVQAGGTPPPLPTFKPPSTSTVVVTNAPATDADGKPVDNGVLADDKFSGYTYNNDGTVTDATGPGLFVMETDAAGNTTPKFYRSKATARDAFLKEYAKTGGKTEALKAQLLSSGYIKKEQLNNGTWVTGIDDMLVAYTVKTVSDTKYNASQEPMGMTAFLALKKTGGSGAGGTSKYQVITTRGDAKKILNTYLMDLVGRNSTPEEEEEFYNSLHIAEGKAVARTADGVTTGRVFTEEERLMLAAKVARKSLKGTDVGELLKASTGSQVAVDISSLQKTAASYGVPMTAAEALKYVAAGLGQEDFLVKQGERLKLVAKQLHPNLVQHIDAGGTVKDIADVYGLAKSTKLGKVVTDSTYDKDVMDALGRNMSLSDFDRQLQAKPEWRETEEAHRVANDFASTILKSFGFGG
jgi:hypothetical protein